MQILIAIYLIMVSTLAAQAADGAKFMALGFSSDTRYFAFEQYGVQDGSGFAYVDIFVLDIQADNWVQGTPVSVLLEDETFSVAAVRTKAKTQVEPILKSLGVTQDA